MSVFHVTTILAPDKKHRATEVVFHYKIVEQFLASGNGIPCFISQPTRLASRRVR